MENISWKNHISSEAVLQRVGEKRHLIKTAMRTTSNLDWSCVPYRDTLVRDILI